MINCASKLCGFKCKLRHYSMAHLLGTCVAAARRGSDAMSAASVSSAAWSLAIISGERANSAEMEVLAERGAAVVDDMGPRAAGRCRFTL